MQAVRIAPARRNHREDLVPVDNLAVLVGDHDPVGIAIERNAHMRTGFEHLAANGSGEGRAAAVIDVAPVGAHRDGHNLRPQLPQGCRCRLVGRAIGAIDDHLEAVQAYNLVQRALGELDIAFVGALYALGLADPVRLGEQLIRVAQDQRLDLFLGLVGELVAIRPEQLDAVIEIRIVRGRDHDAQIGAQRADQHGDGLRRDRAQLYDVHAHGGEARNECRLDRIARKPCVLADHDAMTPAAIGVQMPGGHADLEGNARRHRMAVCLSPDAVRSKKLPCHYQTLFLSYAIALWHRFLAGPMPSIAPGCQNDKYLRR